MNQLIDYDKPHFQTLSIANQLPHALRTFQRAKIFLVIKANEPLLKQNIVSEGYSKRTVEKVLKEFSQENLISERFRLYKLTPFGNQIVIVLIKDNKVRRWLSRRFPDLDIFTKAQISRPIVVRI